MIVEMKQLEYFIVCCDCGSFSKAAQVLYTTQPNVSKVICQMEAQLGCQIFNRTGRGIALTDTGKRIYKYAVSIMENAECITELLNQDMKHIFSIASVPSNCMSDAFKDWYLERKSDYQKMRYLEGSLKNVIDYVNRFEAEVGFIYISHQHLDNFEQMIQSKNIKFVKLSSAVQVLAAGRMNKFYNEPVITEEMQQQMEFVHYQDTNLAVLKDVLLMNQVIDDSGCRHKVITNSENVILNLLENTDLTLLSVDRNCDMYEKETLVRHIPLVSAQAEISFGYIIREDNILNEDMKEFIEKVSQGN